MTFSRTILNQDVARLHEIVVIGHRFDSEAKQYPKTKFTSRKPIPANVVVSVRNITTCITDHSSADALGGIICFHSDKFRLTRPYNQNHLPPYASPLSLPAQHTRLHRQK